MVLNKGPEVDTGASMAVSSLEVIDAGLSDWAIASSGAGLGLSGDRGWLGAHLFEGL